MFWRQTLAKYSNALKRGRKLNKDDSERIGKEIKTDEVMQLILKLGGYKSPGPDGLPTEFYKIHAEMLARTMKEIFNILFKQGAIPDDMKLGGYHPAL